MLKKNIFLNNIYIFILSFCLVQPTLLFGSFEKLITSLRIYKKEIFKSDTKSAPQILFKKIHAQLTSGKKATEIEQAYPDETKMINSCYWSLSIFFHVFIGEYVSKQQADIKNKYVRDLLAEKAERQGVAPKKPVSEYKKGIIGGLHTYGAFSQLRKSCELEGDDYTQVKDVIAFEKGKGFISNGIHTKSCAVVKCDGKHRRVSGVKTFWPKTWSIKDILLATQKAVEEIKNGKLKPSGKSTLYRCAGERNGIKVAFEMHVIKEKSGSYAVQTAYPRSSDAVLNEVAKKRASGTTTTSSTSSSSTLSSQLSGSNSSQKLSNNPKS